MANFTNKLQEIKELLISGLKAEKASAYSAFLHLQQDPSIIQSLSTVSLSIISLILTDIFDEIEEISAQALKCLGFMLYHPLLLPSISGDVANLILDSLTRVILTTKIKSVCNLGVWCISIQQIDERYLASNFPSLLRAIVHAIDNPIGSLSTTFEAIQALMKLGTQLKEKMRDTTSVWGPPIYRRLVSTDKRARDMSERCLLQIKTLICPPTLTLSKGLVLDMKKRLLPGMKELQNQGLHIQAIQAWGWYICLLGPSAKKNRQLVNEMLKILEQTFSSVDSQVQIASLVAWEGLIDTLIQPLTEASEKNNQMVTSGVDEGTSKSLKLIMTPLIGIMSSKCDVSVHSSCFSSWCFLLHKLDTAVNSPSILKLVWDPILDAVFRVRPECKSIFVSNICLELLEEFVSTNIREMGDTLNKKIPSQFSPKLYAVKWLPWSLDQLDFFVKTISMLLNQGYTDGALRILRPFVKGVRSMLESPTISYDEIMASLNTILALVKEIYEEYISGNRDVNDLLLILHKFIELIIEEFEPSILGSPLYKVALNLKYVGDLQSVSETEGKEILKVNFTTYKEMVSPIVYLTLLHLCGSCCSNFSQPGTVLIFQGTHTFIKNVLSSYEPLEVLSSCIGLLYKHKEFHFLKMWIVIAHGLKDYINEVNDISFLKSEYQSSHFLVMSDIMSYPFVTCSSQKQVTGFVGTELKELAISSLTSHRKSELEHVVEVWSSLYAAINSCPIIENSTFDSFTDDIMGALRGCLVSITKVAEGKTELNQRNNFHNDDFTFLNGKISLYMLEHTLELESSNGRTGRYNMEHRSHGIGHVLEFVATFMKLSLVTFQKSKPADMSVLLRVVSTLVQFACCLHFKEDILLFVQVMSNPLLQWLTCSEKLGGESKNQLQLLWRKTLNSMQKSNPPIIFDSAFLNNQSSLFEKALDHPNPSISNPLITFWNSTFALEANLDYPQSLLPILDKLSRKGKIKLFKRNFPSIQKCTSQVKAIPRCTVNSVQNMSSKRVEIAEDKDKPSKAKRIRRELTEHQKEVRRAQQGRGRDCGAHGPGVRTYTGCDFSLGNDESQDSQSIDLRDTEAILEKLRRGP